jgi:L-amino acid N-acyltransferase YncA
MNIRTAELSDALQIAHIYNHYIRTSHATFELEPIDTREMERRLADVCGAGYPFIVAELAGDIIGYSYGRAFRPRAAYRHSIEISVYVKQGFERLAIATELYEELFSEIGKGDFHAVIAGISLPNDASVSLHEKLGLKKVAHFAEVGYKFGRWVDVGYWQLILSK